MNNSPSIRELFDVLEMEIQFLADKTDGNENIGKIKALSLLLEDRVDALYKELKWKNKAQEKPETLKSRTETCMCSQPWVYENAGLCATFGRCRDEYCFMNVKREA